MFSRKSSTSTTSVELSQNTISPWIAAILLVFVNLLVFGVFRAFFITQFANDLGFAEILKTMLYGARLDLVLSCFEILIFLSFLLLLQSIRVSHSIYYLSGLTFFHIFLCLASFWLFEERNEQLGEALITLIYDPGLAELTIYAFIVENPSSLLLIVLFGGLLGLFSFYIISLLDEKYFRLGPLRDFLSVVLLILICFGLSIDKEPVKRDRYLSGWKLKFSHPQRWTVLGNFHLNQAIINPVHDLFRVQIPALLRSEYQAQLTDYASRSLCCEQYSDLVASSSYPILREIRSDWNPRFRNLALIQVEGLSTNILETMVDEGWLMPFLQRLVKEGIYFPSILQGSSYTTGSLFCTVTGLYKENHSSGGRHIMNWEVNGYYSALPSLVKQPGYRHFFFGGLREKSKELTAFMSNQGFEPYTFNEIGRFIRKNGITGEIEGILGINDGPFLEASGKILSQWNGPFTAHLLTSTSHTPWTTPREFVSNVQNRYLKAFQYVDESIRKFIDELKKRDDWKTTLVMITGDHASYTTSNHPTDRLFVPLIIFDPQLQELGSTGIRSDLGSHLDIVPTGMCFLTDRFKYAGFGRDLMSSPSHHWVSSIDRNGTTFVTEKLEILQKPIGAKVVLNESERTEGSEHLDQIFLEYTACLELAQSLSRSRRIIPFRE